ncbi:unnamed protein product [Cuscuta campestris]|uniref:Uncharacterized protein n=1 Tax=Cuscuta campestris TaxID=132261 RepID=A0A484KX66_9ASTE|nr:unnamed protein product [Cuscuta campestris]
MRGQVTDDSKERDLIPLRTGLYQGFYSTIVSLILPILLNPGNQHTISISFVLFPFLTMLGLINYFSIAF